MTTPNDKLDEDIRTTNRLLITMKLESMINRYIAEVVTGNATPTKDFIDNQLIPVLQNPDLYGVPVNLSEYRKGI